MVVPSTEPQTPRLIGLLPDALSDDQRRLYDSITGGQRASGTRRFPITDEQGRLVGPFDAMLRAPRIGDALQSLGAALRFGGGLPDRAREMVILAVANREDSAFERFAHEAVGRGVGLRDSELEALRHGDPLSGDDHIEEVVLRTARILLADRDLDDDDYTVAVAVLGEDGLFELTTIVGYYSTLALQLRVFRVGLPDEQSSR